jgi:hypothetical protein
MRMMTEMIFQNVFLSESRSELVSHWVRIIRCGVNIAGSVDGVNSVEGSSAGRCKLVSR